MLIVQVHNRSFSKSSGEFGGGSGVGGVIELRQALHESGRVDLLSQNDT